MKKRLIAPQLSLWRPIALAVCLLVLLAMRPMDARADHLTITLDPPLLKVEPGTTAAVLIGVQGGNNDLICLDAFIEEEIDVTFAFETEPCSMGDFSATMYVTVGADVSDGAYQVGTVAFVMIDDFPTFDSQVFITLTVERQPTPQPTPTATSSSSPTATPTATRLVSVTREPSVTPMPTASPTATSTASATPTETRIFTVTREPSPTPTPTATHTATATSTPTPTSTFTPAPTQTPTATPTSTQLPDLTVTGLEVTQAIQDLGNRAPLVADKKTFVRVFIRSDQNPIPNVTARLHGRRNGAVLLQSPLAPRQAITAQPSGITTAMRNSLNGGFLFDIPNAWLSGDVRFEVEINPVRAIAERDYANNSRIALVNFERMPPLRMRLVRINYTHSGANLTPTWAEYFTARNWLLDVYPIHRVTTIDGDTLKFDEDLTTEDGMLSLLNDVWWEDFWTPEGDEDTVWFGLVHTNVAMPRTGWAYDLGEENAIGTANPADSGVNMAHEIGHTLERRHIDCGNPMGTDPAYPFNPMHIGQGTADGYYGFDTRNIRVINPTRAADFMSYCWGPPRFAGVGPPWISSYTYSGLRDQIRNNFGVASQVQAASAQQSQDVLALSGIVNMLTDKVSIDYGYRIMRTITLSQPVQSDYTIELRNADAQVLVSQPIEVSGIESVANEWGGFRHILPYHEETEKIVFKRAATVLASIAVSEHPPTVTLLSPNGGEILTDTHTVTWRAADADGDELHYTLQYSPDGGISWQAVAVDIESTQYDLDVRELIGSTKALLRIIVSDGVNTTADQSDALFTVPTKVPNAFLIAPSPQTFLPAGKPITLEGYGYDLEDGPLADSAATWSSSQDGALGSGNTIDVAHLSRGEHMLTFTVVDSDGNESSAQTAVWVGERVLLPLIRR